MIETTAISRAHPPDLIPGYKLEKLVGKGGMGEVHRATQLSLGRTVAVKLLASELATDKAFVTRFEKEAAALAALSHPNIVSIVDKGKAKNTYFLVMEFVDGPSLREMMRSPLLDLPNALKIALEICRAIDYAHGRGIVHRDLKPENILFDEQAGGIPKVSDFGLAAFQDQNVPTKFNLTETHVSMGTLSYMAPEQRVDAKNADHRADIYSLGVILYELLVGEVPMGNFDPPSERKPELDRRLDPIIAKCLRPDPNERYQSVAELIADLEPFAPMTFSQRPRKVGPVERAQLAVQKAVRTALKVAAAALVLAAAGVIAVAVLRGRNDGPEKVTTAEALTDALQGITTKLSVPAKRSSEGETYEVAIGEGPESISATSVGRALEASKDGKLSFAPPRGKARVGRAALQVPEVDGASVQLVSEVSPPEASDGFVARMRSWILGTTPDPRSVLVLSGGQGYYAALTLSASGDQRITFDCALQDKRLTVLDELEEPSFHDGTLRMELSVTRSGDLQAFVSSGKERRPIGVPVSLGAGWKKHFGKMPSPTLACLEGACKFSKVTWALKREAPAAPNPSPTSDAVATTKPAVAKATTPAKTPAKASTTTRKTSTPTKKTTTGKTSTKKTGTRRR